MNATFVRIGLGGGDMGSSYLLPRLVGMANASEILTSGRFVDAARAKAIGLVTDVVDGDALLDAGMTLAADMLKASPMGLRLTNEGLNATLAMPGLGPRWRSRIASRSSSPRPPTMRRRSERFGSGARRSGGTTSVS